jgi:hypothetical protein
MASPLATIIAMTKPLTDSTGSVDVAPVLASVTNLLGSGLANLQVNLNVTITLTNSLQSTLTQCGCDPALLATVNNLLSSLLSLLDVCRNGVPPVDGTDSCLTVDVSHVVCSLRPGVCIDRIFVCGSLGKLLHDLLQPLLNTLGVGVLPATACPKCIATLPSGAATLPSAASTPPTVSSAVATPPAAPSTAAAHPSDPNIVINIAGITIDIALHIGTVAANLDPACGDLIAALVNLVNAILGQPGGLLAGVLRRGLVVDLNLGGSTSSLQKALDAVKNAPDSCKAGGLGPLLDNLLGQLGPTLKNLLKGLLGCGCEDAVTGAIAAAQKKAISTSPTITSLVSRAVSPSDSTDKLIDKAKVVLGLCLQINLACGNMPFAKSFVKQLNAEGINPLLVACVGHNLLRLSDKGTLGGAVATVLGGGNALSVDGMNKLVQTALRLVENARGKKSCGCNRAADQLTQGLNELAKAYGEFLDASKKCGDKGPALVVHVTGLMSQSNIKAFQLLNS